MSSGLIKLTLTKQDGHPAGAATFDESLLDKLDAFLSSEGVKVTYPENPDLVVTYVDGAAYEEFTRRATERFGKTSVPFPPEIGHRFKNIAAVASYFDVSIPSVTAAFKSSMRRDGENIYAGCTIKRCSDI